MHKRLFVLAERTGQRLQNSRGVDVALCEFFMVEAFGQRFVCLFFSQLDAELMRIGENGHGNRYELMESSAAELRFFMRTERLALRIDSRFCGKRGRTLVSKSGRAMVNMPDASTSERRSMVVPWRSEAQAGHYDGRREDISGGRTRELFKRLKTDQQARRRTIACGCMGSAPSRGYRGAWHRFASDGL